MRRGGQAIDLQHAPPSPAGAVGEAPKCVRHRLAETIHQTGEHADRVPEQGAVPREVDVGLDDGGIDAELGAVLEAERDGGLDHGRIEGAHRGRGQPAEGAMKGIVFGDGLAIEGREAPQGVAVGNALAQFAEIPRFDALEHKGPQGLGGAQTGPAGVGMRESPHQVVMDEGDQSQRGELIPNRSARHGRHWASRSIPATTPSLGTRPIGVQERSRSRVKVGRNETGRQASSK